MVVENNILITKQVKRLFKVGDLEVMALRGISVSIKQGEFVVITGRNGSGKSTLLRILGLLDVPTEGSILLNGKEVSKMRELERSKLRLKQLGYIFQEYALVAELTALENIMLPAMMLKPIADCRKRAKELLKKVGLEKKAENLPRQLSGGEQQKVAIARALVNNPEIIFADEPTANLDTTAAKGVLELFQHLHHDEGHTVVMITHEPEETSVADRVVQLSDGKLV